MIDPTPLLRIDGLTLHASHALLEEVDLTLQPGEVLALVGESGSGKSMTAHAVMGLLPPGIRVTAGSIELKGEDVTRVDEARWRQIRGRTVSMVFQESMSALNPVLSIGTQLAEIFRQREDLGKREALSRSRDALAGVRIHDAEGTLRLFPHELSGGMRQRVMIAMALAAHPDLLIADEPTTALDVTVQTEILHLLMDAKKSLGFALLFITHDLSLVAHIADRVAVLYAGMVMEEGATEQVIHHPAHPYTRALLRSRPSSATRGRPLPTIPGNVPSPSERPPGCPFGPRCEESEPRCSEHLPLLVSLQDGACRCIHAENQSG